MHLLRVTQKVGVFQAHNWIYVAIPLRFFGKIKYFPTPKNFIPIEALFVWGFLSNALRFYALNPKPTFNSDRRLAEWINLPKSGAVHGNFPKTIPGSNRRARADPGQRVFFGKFIYSIVWVIPALQKPSGVSYPL